MELQEELQQQEVIQLVTYNFIKGGTGGSGNANGGGGGSGSFVKDATADEYIIVAGGGGGGGGGAKTLEPQTLDLMQEIFLCSVILIP